MMMKNISKEDMAKHHKMMGCKIMVLGAIVLANAYWMFIRWDYLIGIMLVLAGLAKMMMCCRKK